MKQYLDLMQDVLDNGEEREDRTGVGTLSIFGTRLVFDQREGFPLLTTKKLHWKSILHELLWFISGGTNTKYLNDNGVSIWNEWADDEGNLGPIYGKQWRDWGGVDQLQLAIDEIKNNPTSRRILVNAWNVSELDKMALPPCHMMFQLYVTKDGCLDLQIYQRSVDVFLGLPYNIASYSLLLRLIAKTTGKTPRYLIWLGGDTHLYKNHIEQAKTQLKRPYWMYRKPQLYITKKDNISDYTEKGINLVDYKAYPHIKADIAV